MRENDVKQIKDLYKRFLNAWEQNDEEAVGSCLKYIPFAYVSMYGHAYSPDQIVKWFKNPGPEGSTLRIYPLQNTVLTEGNLAQQYAAIIGVIEKDDAHLAFAGSFMNTYELTNKGWTLETIRFQLQSDDGMKEEYLEESGVVARIPGEGDRSLMGEWLGVDERVGAFQDKIEHSGDCVITAEIDAPWRVLKNPDNYMTDEEMIMDTLCKTSCSFDFYAVQIAIDAFTKNASSDLNCMFGELDYRDSLIYARELRRSLPRCFSGLTVNDLTINADKASLVLTLSAPEAAVKTENGYSFVKAVYDVELLKCCGQWQISRLYIRK